MRIGVDLHVLTGKFQGSRRYLSNIYRSLLSQDRTNEYFLFVNDTIKLREPWLSLGQLIEFGATSSLSRLTRAPPLLSKRHKLDMGLGVASVLILAWGRFRLSGQPVAFGLAKM